MKLSLFLIGLSLFFGCKGDKKDAHIDRKDEGVELDISLSGSLQNPAFSPDNQSIVFTRFLNGYNEEPAEIYKYHLTTKELVLLVGDGSANVNLPGTAWVNGKIVFSSAREPHDEIYMIDENGQSGEEIQITDRAGKVAYEPTFSPDGKWVVFESHILDVEAHGVIVKYKADGSSSYVALSEENDDCRQPNWSPKGDKILYQKLDGGQWNIWTMDNNGEHPFQVTKNMGNCTDASFSGDGQSIVFSSDYQVEIANIFSINIDGTNRKKLTNFDGYDGATSISSDGNKLVFESTNGDPDESKGSKIILMGL